MTRANVTIVIETNTLMLRGWKSRSLLDAAEVRGSYNAAAGGWLVAPKHLADLLALCESRGLVPNVVDLTDVGGGDAA